MSDILSVDTVKVTSPCWQDGIGLLAKDVVVEVNDDLEPISARFGRLIGPRPILKAFLDRLADGPVSLTLSSLQGDEHVSADCIAKRGYEASLSVMAEDMQVVEEFRIDFAPVANDSARKKE